LDELDCSIENIGVDEEEISQANEFIQEITGT